VETPQPNLHAADKAANFRLVLPVCNIGGQSLITLKMHTARVLCGGADIWLLCGGSAPMDQLRYRDGEKFWAPRTSIQLILLGVAGFSFLIGLVAIMTTNLAH
jgi:hypothetical protein